MRARKAAAASAHFFSAKSFSALRTRSSKEMESLFSLAFFLSSGARALARSGERAGSCGALSSRSSSAGARFVFLAGPRSAGAGAAAKATGASSAARGEGAAATGAMAEAAGALADEPAPAPTAPLLPSARDFGA